MPLYTYVMTHKGQTVVLQESRSNYRGWMANVVGRAFPKVPKQALTEAWKVAPEPAGNLKNVWRGSAELEHRAEKWPPVFGKKRCSIKHLEPHV